MRVLCVLAACLVLIQACDEPAQDQPQPVLSIKSVPVRFTTFRNNLRTGETTFTFNAAGYLAKSVTTIDPAPPSNVGSQLETIFAYDAANRLVERTTGAGPSAMAVLKMTYANNMPVRYEGYTANYGIGNVMEFGRFQYGADGRLTSIIYNRPYSSIHPLDSTSVHYLANGQVDSLVSFQANDSPDRTYRTTLKFHYTAAGTHVADVVDFRSGGSGSFSHFLFDHPAALDADTSLARYLDRMGVMNGPDLVNNIQLPPNFFNRQGIGNLLRRMEQTNSIDLPASAAYTATAAVSGLVTTYTFVDPARPEYRHTLEVRKQ